MTDWKQLSDGWRTWAKVDTAARWRYGAGGDLEAIGADGQPLNTAPDAKPFNYLATAVKVIPAKASEMRQVTQDAFYVRALLTIGLHETHFRALPIYGDCRDVNNPKKVVACGSANAAPPLSVGYYQFLRSTAKNIGVSWAELATSPIANHKAALKLAQLWADDVQNDLPTLAAKWGAGSVRADPSKDWGVRTWAADTLTQFAQCWNAVGRVLRGGESQGARGSSELDAFEAGALLFLAWRLAR